MIRPHWELECDFGHKFSAAMYKDTVLQSGPRIYHRMTETSGATIADLNGAVPATLLGTEGTHYARNVAGPLATGEPADRATSFTPVGAGDLGAAAFTLPSFPSDTLTLEFWIYVVDITVTTRLVSNSGSAANRDIFIVEVRNPGKLFVQVGDSASSLQSADNALVANTWYHVVLTAEAGLGRLRLYLNASQVAVGSRSEGFLIAQTNKAWRYGHAAGGTQAPDFRLDEVAIYDFVLAAADVTRHYGARNTVAAAAPFKTSLTPFMRETITWSRGRKTWLAKPETGRASVVLDNRDRRFEPGYAGELVNLVPNPSFEVDTAGWTAVNCTAFRSSPNHAYRGGYSGGLLVTAGGDAYIWRTVTGLTATTAYTLAAYCRPDVAGMTARVQIDWYTAADVFISTSAGTNTALPTGQWTQLAVAASAPVTADRARIHLLLVGPSAAQAAYFDAVQFEAGTAPSAYIDGSLDSGRWEGTAHASRSYRGGPYYPNVKNRRKLWLTATYPPNLARFGSFEDGDTGWAKTETGSGGITINSHATDHWHGRGSRGNNSGSFSGWRAFSNAPGAGTSGTLTSTEFIPVDPAKPYTLTAAFKPWNGTDIAAAQSAIRLQCFDKAQASLGFVYPNATPDNATAAQVIYQAGVFNPTASVWTRHGGTYTTEGFPVGTAFVKIEIVLHFNSNAGVNVDAIELRPGRDASLTTNVDAGYDEGLRYECFTTYVEDFNQEPRGALNGMALVPSIDLVGILAETKVGERFFPQTTVANRVKALLNLANQPEAERVIYTVVNLVSDLQFSADANLAEHLLEIANFEWGMFYADARGYAILQGATYRATYEPSVRATFKDHDNGTNPMYEEIDWETGTQSIINVGKSQRPGGTQQVVTFPASIEEYGHREYTEPMPAADDATVLTRLEDIVDAYDQPLPRVRSITVNPDLRTTSGYLWPLVLGADLSDRYQVERTPHGVGTAHVWQPYIEGLEAVIDVETGVARFKWYLPSIA